jgi:asparagine synthase (glutamine-hydrolysing)
MCGIAATINGSDGETQIMGRAISNRGLNTKKTRVNELCVSFVHLPIVANDFNQPCTYGDVTVWLNGFISNWEELCKRYRVIAENDTEYLSWHLAKGKDLSELNGFFAVLYYQDGVKMFTDRYGIKQLYKIKHNGTTYICSEVKGLKAVLDLKVEFDGLADLEYSLGVMNEHTIYANVERVECLPFVKPEKIEVDYETAKETLLKLWANSIVRNYYDGAGCYLSGGVDSGMIAKSLSPKYTFSVDYLNELSEIDNIKENSTGIHCTMICNESFKEHYSKKTFEALDDFKAGSCYTNFAIAELASKHCHVIYSGAGGDEVFNGYTHRYNRPINEVIRRTDKPLREYDITHKEYDWKFLKAVLVVEDRMGGYHCMETRYPLLDNEFVDYALSLPDEYLDNKRILKDISGLSYNVLNGKKKGFSNPHYTNQEWVNYVKGNL